MRKNIFLAILAVLIIGSMLFTACTSNPQNNEPEKNPDTSNEVKPNETDNQGENTSIPDDGSSDPEFDDEYFEYFYNPKPVKATRIDDHTVAFEVDNPIKLADGFLASNVYFATEETGEPVAFASDIFSYDGNMAITWIVEFADTIPEGGFVCIGEDADDGDASLNNAFVDSDGNGIYGKTEIDGKRYTVIEITTDDPIVIHPWVYINDDDASITYVEEGGGTRWAPQPGMNYAKGNSHTYYLGTSASDRGYLEYTFTGTGLRVYGVLRQGNLTNKLQIYIDGELAATVDQCTNEGVQQYVQYENTELAAGEHKIKIINSPDASIYYWDFDGFGILS